MEIREKIEAHEQEVYEELVSLARPHIETSNGLFHELEIKPGNKKGEYPAQSLHVSKIKGSPLDVGMVEWIATGIEPRFPQLITELNHLEQDHEEISRIGEILRDGQNIILASNHGDIKDIAYTLAAYYIKLKSLEYNFHSSLVMSKIIGFIGVGEGKDPAVNVLKSICDEEYFSFPRTQSIENSKIAGPLVDAYNFRVRRAMMRRLHKGNNLFAMAPSGTTDKPMRDNPNTVVLGQVRNGTGKLMMAENSLVVPVATWITKDTVLFEPCGIPRVVKSQDEVHEVMEQIADHLTNRIPEKLFVYNRGDTEQAVGGVAVQNS
jgi:hypothetical protein